MSEVVLGGGSAPPHLVPDPVTYYRAMWYPFKHTRDIAQLQRWFSIMASNLQTLEQEVTQLGPALDTLNTEVQALIAQSQGVPQSTLDAVTNALAQVGQIGANVQAATSSSGGQPAQPPVTAPTTPSDASGASSGTQ